MSELPPTPDAETTKPTCPDCGAALPDADTPCTNCSANRFKWEHSRTVFLSLCGLLLIPMFTTTGVIVRLYHSKQAKIAADWEKAGNINLQSGQAATAIDDFRNALLYAPNDSQVQLDLAQALAAQGQLDEAQSYLFNLRTADPENSLIDLALARVSAQQGDIDAAVGFYHDAAFGQWSANAHASRVSAREELIAFLLRHNRQDQARAEALSMAADNPADPEIRNAAASFLSQAGDTQSAFDEYEHVLQIAPNDRDALLGAGKAALALYDFAAADRYFSRAIQHGDRAPDIQADRDLAVAAGELDPLADGLSDNEKRERTVEMFTAAETRAKSCLPDALSASPSTPNNLTALANARSALPAHLSLAEINAHPEVLDQALAWAFSVEKAAPSQCVGTLADRAIEFLAQKDNKS